MIETISTVDSEKKKMRKMWASGSKQQARKKARARRKKTNDE